MSNIVNRIGRLAKRSRSLFRIHRKRSQSEVLMDAFKSIRSLEEQGLMLVDPERPGVVLTMEIWLVYFTKAYLKTRSDDETLKFLYVCRALANFRRLAEGKEMHADDVPLFITCMSEASADAVPMFIGYATDKNLVLREYAEVLKDNKEEIEEIERSMSDGGEGAD